MCVFYMVLESLATVCIGPPLTAFCLRVQRYNIFRAIPNFGHRFGANFSTKLLNSSAIAFCVHQMVSFMEGRLWISDNKASLLEIETGRDAPDR